MARGRKSATPPKDGPEVTEAAAPDVAPEAVPEAVPEAEPVPEPVIEPEVAPEPEPESEPAPLPETPTPEPRPRGGFWPMLLGGVLAAAVGFAAAWWLGEGQGVDTTALETRLAAQEQALTALEARIQPPEPAPDLTPLSDATAALATRTDTIEARAADLSATLAALTARVDTLEQAPIPITPGAAPAADPALRTDLAALSARVDALATELDARDDALRGAIAEQAAAAEASATATLHGAALVQLQAALQSGEHFADALAAVTDAPPATLAALADTGTPTMAALRTGYPEAARTALAAARSAGLAQDGGGFTGWLRSTFNIRSTAPREGGDPDAVLSRAEGALETGDLDAALATLATLPDAVRAGLGDWLAQAQMRQQALTEAAALAAADGN